MLTVFLESLLLIQGLRVESTKSGRLIPEVIHASSLELLFSLIVGKLAVRTCIVPSRDLSLIQKPLYQVVSASSGAASTLRGEGDLFVNPRRPTRHQVVAKPCCLDRAFLVALLHHGSSHISLLLETLQDLLFALLIELGAAQGARMEATPVRRLTDVVMWQLSS